MFVMVCETRPLPVYPIVFRHPGLPVGRKHSIFNLNSSSCVLVPVGVVNLASCACVKSEEEGLVKKNVSNILNLDCNT